MNRINYQRRLDRLIEGFEGKGEVPTLLLHACCAPCSSYTLEYLSEYFAITVYYYNPNIYPKEEYELRLSELRRLLAEMKFKHPVKFLEGTYEPSEYYSVTKGLEREEEGGERCMACFRLRLTKAAELAKKMGFDYFTTTLSIGPKKNSDRINEIGEEVGEMVGVRHLPGDFKRKKGYERSLVLSREHHLYRQNYCGCIFSRNKDEKKDERL